MKVYSFRRSTAIRGNSPVVIIFRELKAIFHWTLKFWAVIEIEQVSVGSSRLHTAKMAVRMKGGNNNMSRNLTMLFFSGFNFLKSEVDSKVATSLV